MATKMMWGQSHLPYEQRLRDMWLFSLEKTEEDLSNAYKYLKGGCQMDGARLFLVSVQWQDKGQQAQEVPSEHEKELLYCVVGRALEQTAQSGCGVSLCGLMQNPWQFPVLD